MEWALKMHTRLKGLLKFLDSNMIYTLLKRRVKEDFFETMAI